MTFGPSQRTMLFAIAIAIATADTAASSAQGEPV
jgi:uncharacterized membrane protein